MIFRALKHFTVAMVALLFVFTGTTVAQQRVILDKVVAVVGGSSILKSEVDNYVKTLEYKERYEGYTSERDHESEALEELMTLRLLYSQALIDSVEIDHAYCMLQADQQINAMITEAGGIAELERAQNMQIYNLKAILQNKLKERSYAEGMRSEILSRVSVTPGEVERFYKNIDKEDLPIIGDQYRYAQITRFPQSMEEAKRRIREELLSMRERIISGTAQFSSLAQMYSADPGSAYRGGVMEPMPSSAFTENFADALEALQPGQLSEVVETEFGYHIIELIDKKGDQYYCRHILLRPSYTAAELMEPILFLDSLASVIRNDSISFSQAALIYSDDALSKMNGGVVTNHDLLERVNQNDPRLTVTKFMKEDFGSSGYKSLEDFVQLSKLQKGDISEAFTTQDLSGNQLAKIVTLLEIYPAHVASLNEDYLQLENLALNDKNKKIFTEWLDKHIRSTYIFIDEDYRSLDFENKNWVK